MDWMIVHTEKPTNTNNFAKITADTYSEAYEKAEKVILSMNTVYKNMNSNFSFEIVEIRSLSLMESWDM